MRQLRYGMTIWFFWGTLISLGFAQELPSWLMKTGEPKPPEYGIRDESGFFSRNSGATKRISDLLTKLEETHHFRIYLMVEPVLIASNAPELAAQLQQTWLPKGDGLVVVFESNTRSMGFGREIDGAPDERESSHHVPTHETAAILNRVMAATDKNLSPEAYIETLMAGLVREFDQYFVNRNSQPSEGETLRLALLFIGAVALLALGAIGVGMLVKLPSMAGTQRFRFPVVDRPERLGAPCGGGDVTTRKFKR